MTGVAMVPCVTACVPLEAIGALVGIEDENVQLDWSTLQLPVNAEQTTVALPESQPIWTLVPAVAGCIVNLLPRMDCEGHVLGCKQVVLSITTPQVPSALHVPVTKPIPDGQFADLDVPTGDAGMAGFSCAGHITVDVVAGVAVTAGAFEGVVAGVEVVGARVAAGVGVTVVVAVVDEELDFLNTT